MAPVVAAPWTAAVTVALLAQRKWSILVAGRGRRLRGVTPRPPGA